MKKRNLPRVTILMSVYNGEQYLAEAIDSILNQTFADFEFVIINDGSTDGTSKILETYHDPRLRIVEQENIGLTRSLNRGIELAQGEFIARMDADDISMPNRLAKQVDFLDLNLDVGVVGSCCFIRDESSQSEWAYDVPSPDDEIRLGLIKGNQLIHTSVMIRTSLLQMMNGYDESYRVAQDYALWVKLAPLTKFANLPEALVVHREHSQAISITARSDWPVIWRAALSRFELRYKLFRTQDYPVYYVLYILHAIPLALFELWPSLKNLFKR